jgi:LysM repeat protein
MGDNASTSSSLDLGESAPQGGIKSTAVSKAYENAKDLAMEQINRGELKEGLATLSTFYNAPELTDEQRQDLLDLLDALAREVVYSRRHMLDSVYIVAPGETLSDISKRYDVPGEIIARINAIESTKELPSGARLKVVPGPFRAEVDLTRGELTVFLGDLYAGRYPVTFGNEPAPKPGLFQVIDKQTNKNYYGNGVQILSNDPRNPYGGWWIDLGQDVCIHGSSEGPSDGKLGCISLSPLDASDLFGMLGRGSPVTIKR